MSDRCRAFLVICLLSLWIGAASPASAQTVNCAGVGAWNPATIYNPGDRLVYQNSLYEAVIQIWNTPPDHCPSCNWYRLLGTCGTGGGGGNPPTVALTEPPNGTSVPVGTTLQVAATASDSNGTVSRVEFFDNGGSIGVDTVAPYAVSWTGGAGSHTLTARATDNSNLSTTSAPRTVTITGGGGGGGGFPTRVFAPYVDVLLGDFAAFRLTQNMNAVSRFYTLAFIINGGNCEARWGGIIPLSQDGPLMTDINSLRAAGGDVIVSFGGALGVELAQSCQTDDALLAQYQAVVNRYRLRRVDFDIEGGAIGDPTSRSRRNRVLRRLRAANPNLQIQYTLPVLPSGLTTGVQLLQDANANGFVPDIVNIMAMDYGTSFPLDMGQNAIDAMNGTVNQLRTIFPGRTTAQYWAMIGVTPMIGVNDVMVEIFQLSDARDVLAFARAQGAGLIGMWSANRDHQCTPQETGLFQCTRIQQAPFAFSQIFRGFNP